MARPIGRAAPAPDFIAVDVETANADPGSICQIGLASFAGGALVDCAVWRVNPRAHFSPHNIAIHGLHAADVRDAPDWPALRPTIAARLAGRIAVSHTAFDVTALARACAADDLAPRAYRPRTKLTGYVYMEKTTEIPRAQS